MKFAKKRIYFIDEQGRLLKLKNVTPDDLSTFGLTYGSGKNSSDISYPVSPEQADQFIRSFVAELMRHIDDPFMMNTGLHEQFCIRLEIG